VIRVPPEFQRKDNHGSDGTHSAQVDPRAIARGHHGFSAIIKEWNPVQRMNNLGLFSNGMSMGGRPG